MTPSKIFQSKHKLSKDESKVSLEKVVPQRISMETVPRQPGVRPSILRQPSEKDKAGEMPPKEGSRRTVPRFKTNPSVVTFGEDDPHELELMVNALDTNRQRRRSSNVSDVEKRSRHDRERKSAGLNAPKSRLSEMSGRAPIATDMAAHLSSHQPLNVSNDLTLHKRKPPMDDTSTKVSKTLKPSKASKTDDRKDRRRSSLSLQLPAGDGNLSCLF